MFIYLLVVLVAIAIGVKRVYFPTIRRSAPVSHEKPSKPTVSAFDKALIRPIEPTFKWQNQLPLPIRPFHGKTNFKITMGISNLAPTPEDWLLIENTYKDNISNRKEVTTKFPKNTSFVNDSPRARAAAVEFYDKVVRFMCERYPNEFAAQRDGRILNTITGEYLLANTEDPTKLLLSLAGHIEEDFLLLLKDDPSDPDQEYILRASLTGFANGFDPAEGHNQPISIIHKPVPSYKSRLQFSMSKFFNRLTPADLWLRHNWSIQTHTQQFTLTNNHAYGDEKVEQLKYEDIDFDNACFLRVERQVLSRLPKLGALFMTVRTYLTPIKQVKEEGFADELCFAIDALPEDLAFYKRRGAWGEAVKQYLRN